MALRRSLAFFVSNVTLLLACAHPAVGTAELTAATLRTPINASRVVAETGGDADVAGSVVQVTFPREDVSVEVDGWKRVPAQMGLVSWVAFAPSNKPDVEANVSGELALFEDEVDATIGAAIDHGLDVTALDGRFFFDAPAVRFMHVTGEGAVTSLAKAVRATMNAQVAVRQRSPHPRSQLFGAAVPTSARVDAKKLDAILEARGVRGAATYRATLVRATAGQGTWTAFAGTDGDAVATGDFAVSEAALQPVIRALHQDGLYIVSIRSDVVPAQKRFIVSYWGRGVATSLAATIKHAVNVMSQST
jgi:hypothetical protein